MPGLDGIRAVAVLAIILYHSGFSWISGGYYSVDAFFALSGFLITSLLVAEWKRSTSISLSAFWARRARRLLPGLFLMLAGIGALSALWPSDLASPHLRSDAFFTLFYVANWHFIAAHANYFFATSQPSPLLHTWTLAIEEQFYIVWPLVVVAVLGRRRAGDPSAEPGRRRRLKALLAISVTGAVGSAILMSLLAQPGGDPTRVYYGTDTRAQSLLIGAALAVGLALWRPAPGKRSARALSVMGLAGAAATALLWTRVDESSAFAFRGCFALAALATAAIIACVAQAPTSAMARVLSVPPLTYLGKISYGVYLWYWPTLLVVNHASTGLSGYPLVGARIAVVVSVATVSYYAIEQPVRRGSLTSWKAWIAAPLAAGAAATSIAMATALVATPATASVTLASTRSSPNGVDPPLASAAPSSSSPASPSDPSAPVKVLLVGDSMAGSLGVGLQEVQARYGTQVVDQGAPGCSAGMEGDFRVLWYTVPPGPPCVLGNDESLLTTWRQWVTAYNPDVAVYFARADLMDQSVGGVWENVTDPSYDRFLRARLEQAVAVLGGKGAHVVLLTSPLYDSGEQANGEGWPEDSQARVAAYNAILRQVAAEFPASVSVEDAGSFFSPHATTPLRINNIPMRCSDGVHLTPQAGVSFAATLLPRISTWGREHASSSPAGSWTGYRAGAPDWYTKLTCP